MNGWERRGLALWLVPQLVAMAVLMAMTCCSTTEQATIKKDATAVLQELGVKGEPIEAPGLTKAVAAIWQLYGRTDQAPRVLLVTGPDLSCTDPSSSNPGFPVIMLTGPDCREGYTLLPFAVSVAYRGQPWSQSALAHELAHVVLIRSLQGQPIGDPDHKTAWFELGGTVDQVNSKLVTLGL